METPLIIDHHLSWPNGTPQKRPRTLGLVVHHTAGNPRTETVETIHAYHRDHNSWLGIGYNWLIAADGTIHLGRPDGTIGAHCTGINSDYAGVALSGNFMKAEPTDSQLDSCAKLWAWLSERYGWDLDPGTLTGHRDHQRGNSCPGDGLYSKLGIIVLRGRQFARGGILEWQGHTLTYSMSSDGSTALVGVRELADALGLEIDVRGWPHIVVR